MPPEFGNTDRFVSSRTMGCRLYGVKGEPMTTVTTVSGRNERSSSRLRVFREEELNVDDDEAFGEAPTTDLTPTTSRTRAPRDTAPMPLPRPPRR
jgi:hypothetical protein